MLGQKNPVVVPVVEKLFTEEQQYNRAERRSLYRHFFSRPVAVRLDDKREIVCFSRNLSFEGIGLISHIEFEPNAAAKIEIHSNYIDNPIMTSQMAWCRSFGDGWFMSGWQFLALASD